MCLTLVFTLTPLRCCIYFIVFVAVGAGGLVAGVAFGVVGGAVFWRGGSSGAKGSWGAWVAFVILNIVTLSAGYAVVYISIAFGAGGVAGLASIRYRSFSRTTRSALRGSQT